MTRLSRHACACRMAAKHRELATAILDDKAREIIARCERVIAGNARTDAGPDRLRAAVETRISRTGEFV